MLERIRVRFRLAAITLILALLTGNAPSVAQTDAEDGETRKGAAGQRVFSAGHSFHMFVPQIINDMAAAADIKGHVVVGLSFIGGSRVIQHWNVPEEKNKSKKALRTGEVVRSVAIRPRRPGSGTSDRSSIHRLRRRRTHWPRCWVARN